MNMFVLVTDPLGQMLGPVVMDFLVPGLVAGFILMYVLYTWAKQNGWI